MWFKQDQDESSVKSKTPVLTDNGFKGATVAINLVYRRYQTDNVLSGFTSKVKCDTYEEFIKTKNNTCELIKIAGEMLKNAKEDEIVILFDSLVIKKSQFISLNLDTTLIP
jgi:dsDNA-binding SOS-regulon protein